MYHLGHRPSLGDPASEFSTAWASCYFVGFFCGFLLLCRVCVGSCDFVGFLWVLVTL